MAIMDVAQDQAVEVGPFWVVDATATQVVGQIVDAAISERDRAVLVYALHVGGLNERHDPAFVEAMREADLVYADGGSVVWLARRSGAAVIERAPTTDIGWDVLRDLSARLGRPARVALIGGPEGLAERAGAEMEASGWAEIVYVTHGYHQDWTDPLAEARAAVPDVTVVGLGAPREMVWAKTWREQLPVGVLLTCGGWFGHIVGDEKRAPRVLRHSGVEWMARFAQAPRRLGPRYAKGIVSTAVIGAQRDRRSARV